MIGYIDVIWSKWKDPKKSSLRLMSLLTTGLKIYVSQIVKFIRNGAPQLGNY